MVEGGWGSMGVVLGDVWGDFEGVEGVLEVRVIRKRWFSMERRN